MDRQQIGLKLTLDALKLPLSLGTFDERLVLQKTIYLCQAAGVDLGYHFGWYLKGPYSPTLTSDAFALRSELARDREATKIFSLDTNFVEKLRILKSLLNAETTARLARKLELLASVHFLRRTHEGRNADTRGLREILKRNDKDFSETEVRDAIEELKQHGLALQKIAT
jgi:uncharacterized protein YwgA